MNSPREPREASLTAFLEKCSRASLGATRRTRTVQGLLALTSPGPYGSISRASSTAFAAASRVNYRPRHACDCSDFFGHVGGSLGMAQVGVEEPGGLRYSIHKRTYLDKGSCKIPMMLRSQPRLGFEESLGKSLHPAYSSNPATSGVVCLAHWEANPRSAPVLTHNDSQG
jgi:hypothetical protein